MKKLQACVLALTLALTGCEITQKQPDVHDFGLPLSGGHNANPVAVDIEAPKWLWDTRIRYRLLYKSPTKISFYMLDRWIATPPELFKQQLMAQSQSLRYPLTLKFLDFEQQFLAPNKAQVIMRVSVTALTEDNKPLATKEFVWQRPTASPDAKGAVEAFALLVQTAIKEIDSWLEGLG
jgi:cholesterol transport system auxiliary component